MRKNFQRVATFFLSLSVPAIALFFELVPMAVIGAGNAPKVPFIHSKGVNKFQALCSGCHGKWGHGTKQGPPLMHAYYKPSHHNDAAFYKAAREGVQAHHWKFGDMPKVKGATIKDMDAIIPFLRWLQRDNGVYVARRQ